VNPLRLSSGEVLACLPLILARHDVAASLFPHKGPEASPLPVALSGRRDPPEPREGDAVSQARSCETSLVPTWLPVGQTAGLGSRPWAGLGIPRGGPSTFHGCGGYGLLGLWVGTELGGGGEDVWTRSAMTDRVC